MSKFIWLEEYGADAIPDENGNCADFFLRKDTVIYFQRQYDNVFIVKTVQEEYLCRFVYETFDEDGKPVKAYESKDQAILQLLRY